VGRIQRLLRSRNRTGSLLKPSPCSNISRQIRRLYGQMQRVYSPQRSAGARTPVVPPGIAQPVFYSAKVGSRHSVRFSLSALFTRILNTGRFPHALWTDRRWEMDDNIRCSGQSSLLGHAHCFGAKNATTFNQLNGDGQNRHANRHLSRYQEWPRW
jgi:hypothetical protein